MRRKIACAMLCFLAAPAFAQQPSDDTAGNVSALSRRITEMRELLSARDPAMRDAAIETALRDTSPAIRGLAISYALRRYDRMPLAFNLPQGSTIQPEDLPSMNLDRVKWSDDGRTMAAAGSQCGGGSVSGQVTSDRLRLHFQQICLTGEFGPASRHAGSRQRATVLHGCEAELSPTTERDFLAGNLRCPGLSTALPLRLPLG